MSNRVAVVMAVKNEAELLTLHIEHHLRLGVHKLYIMDCDSSDGSREILQGYANHPQIHAVFSNIDGNFHNMHRLRLLAFADKDVDYLFHLDPDEFLVVQNGLSLPDIMYNHTDIVYCVRRFNAVVIQHIQQLSAEVTQNLHQMLYYTNIESPAEDEPSSIASIFQKNMSPKVLHKTVEGFIDAGGHGFATFGSTNEGQEAMLPGNMFLAHLPVTSLKRFKTRAESIYQKVQKDPSFFKHHVSHWWLIAQGYEEGILDEMYASCTPSASTIKTMIRRQKIAFGHKLLKAKDLRGNTAPNVRVGNLLTDLQVNHLKQLPQDKIFI